jgi:hypothetical protein
MYSCQPICHRLQSSRDWNSIVSIIAYWKHWPLIYSSVDTYAITYRSKGVRILYFPDGKLFLENVWEEVLTQLSREGINISVAPFSTSICFYGYSLITRNLSVHLNSQR